MIDAAVARLRARDLQATGRTQTGASRPRLSIAHVKFEVMLPGPLWSAVSGRKVRFLLTQSNQQGPDLPKELAEAGQLRPVIDRRVTLGEVPDTMRYLETGHAHGKVIITT